MSDLKRLQELLLADLPDDSSRDARIWHAIQHVDRLDRQTTPPKTINPYPREVARE